MLDLNKLNSQFDMNNIDPAQMVKALAEHQNTLIKTVLIIVSLIYGGVIFNNHRIKDQALHDQMSQLQDKLAAIKVRDAAVKDLNGFKSSLPKKINEFGLIKITSDYSKSCHVNILTLSPAESKDFGLYDVINVSFTAMADNFKNMMLFIRKIEKSEIPLRVDSWSGHESKEGNIIFSMQISAVLLHS